jgi:hypothetical protein
LKSSANETKGYKNWTITDEKAEHAVLARWFNESQECGTLRYKFCLYIFTYVCGSTAAYTVNPTLLPSSFVWLIQLSLLHMSLFKEIIKNYFSQGKCEFMKILFVFLGKMKNLTL